MADVAVEAEVDVHGRRIACAKISSGDTELNVRAAASEFAALGSIRSANWTARQTLAIGTSAGAPVYWASDGDNASILVGLDDETWNVAVNVPVHVIDRMVELVQDLDR